MLRAVTFDLWQTLLLDTPEGLRQARAERIRGVHDLLARQGFAVDRDAVSLAYDAVGPRLENVWATRQDVGSRGQVRLLLECLGLDGAVSTQGGLLDALEEAYCLPILSAMPILNAGARDLLETLQTRGLRLVLERLGLAPYLSVLSFSDEGGLRKPHPEIFHRTLSALSVAPAQAAHVGDDVTTDVAGARGVGMWAIHLCHSTSVSQHSDGAESIPSLHALPGILFSIR